VDFNAALPSVVHCKPAVILHGTSKIQLVVKYHPSPEKCKALVAYGNEGLIFHGDLIQYSSKSSQAIMLLIF
jgi:hypothetical protein